MYSWGATVTTQPMARSGAVSSCAAQWELAELVSLFVPAFPRSCAAKFVAKVGRLAACSRIRCMGLLPFREAFLYRDDIDYRKWYFFKDSG